MKATGPFFKKVLIDDKPRYILADFCEQCAFGDENACLLNPCIYFQFDDEPEENDEEKTNE